MKIIKYFLHNRKNISAHRAYAGEQGLSLVEIVIAAAIISVALVSIMQISGQSLVMSRQSVNIYTAATLLEEGAEAVRTVRDNGWSNISALSDATNYYPTFATSTNTWSLSASTSTVGNFTRTVVFSPVYRDLSYNIATSGTAVTSIRLVTVTVSWKESIGTIAKTLSFYISDIFS